MTTEATTEIATRELPEPVSRRGIPEASWLTLCNNLFPGADPKSVLMVWDYCAARKLDPLKKPCHIVPMNVKDARTGNYLWRDVVMPGIYEFRITAHRTGEYLGHSKAEYGPVVDHKGVSAPEWCDLSVYKLVKGNKVEFPVRCYFKEVVVTNKDGKVNDRWTRAPIQMMTKCTEAAGLREAFPEELGGEHTEDEMSGRIIDTTSKGAQGASGSVPDNAVSPGVGALQELSEALQETIEKAFEGLGLTPGLRLAKLNEWLLSGDNIPLEEKADRLLNWCRDEYAKRKTGQPRAPKGDQNGKGKVGDSGQAGPSVQGAPASDPVGAVSKESPASSAPQAQVTTPLTADEVFGKKAAPIAADQKLGF